MVALPSPPPQPLLDTSFFPFSPSMAAAAGMPPPVAHGNLPSMSKIPGMAGYSSLHRGPPAAFAFVPAASASLSQFGQTASARHPFGALATH